MTTQRQALRRSRQNRVVAGVCGGLAEFFGVSSFSVSYTHLTLPTSDLV